MSDTSSRRCRSPDSMEQACVLCRRAEADQNVCGRKLDHHGVCAHLFCLLFANEIHPQGTQREGQIAFPRLDIQNAVQQAAQMDCFVCGEKGATITCQETGCDRRFHLPCAAEGGCITRYFLPYSSFCWEHRPQQQEVAAPENTTCLVCLDPVEGTTTYGTMVCPACKHAWFHRACIQGQAMRAGIFCLQCPLCRNKKKFLTEMFFMGIRIPIRQASWEDNSAYAELYQRHSSCSARECLCPGGREEEEPDGPWQLLLCRSCAAEGTHRRCSNVGNNTHTWECDSCAGVGTSSSASLELAGPSTASPAASEQSLGSQELESSSPSTSCQAALGQPLGPPAQETSSPSTASQVASGQTLGPPPQETSSRSSIRQMPSGPCHGTPVHEGSSRSSPPGPNRQRHQTRCNRQTQTPYMRPRGQRETSRLPATRAASNTRSQAVPRLSECSTSRETHSRSANRQQPTAASHDSAPMRGSRSNRASGPMRVRDHSRLQRRAQAPYAQPRRRSQRSRTPAAQAGRTPGSQAVPRLSQRSQARASHSRSTTRQRPSASSYGSRARHRGSTSRSTGLVQVRDRSRLQRRAQTPSTRRKRRRESSHTPAPRAKRCARRQAASGLSQRSPSRASSCFSSDSQESSGSRSASSDSQEAL